MGGVWDDGVRSIAFSPLGGPFLNKRYLSQRSN